MKIAQIAPLQESVPPRLYGGTERVVSYLTEELVKQGHDVTLFASGDSITSARLIPFCDRALRLDPRVKDSLPYHIVMLDAVREMARQFDVLHFHVDVLHYPLIRDFVDRTVTTLHGRLDLPEVRRLYSVFSGAPLVSISMDQRKPMPPVNWAGMVYHGLPRDLLPFNAAPKGGYLAFIGRISPEKRPDRAIEIAARAGARLKIAAKVDRVDQEYWEERIKPLVDANPNVEFIGEIDERQKAQFLGEAKALLFPIDWPEPFGMVMIEFDGLRDAGGRLPMRLLAGNRRRWRFRIPRRHRGRGGRGRPPDRQPRSPSGAGGLRSAIHDRARRAQLSGDLSSSAGRPGDVASLGRPHLARRRPSRGRTRSLSATGSARRAPSSLEPRRAPAWLERETRPLRAGRSL